MGFGSGVARKRRIINNGPDGVGLIFNGKRFPPLSKTVKYRRNFITRDARTTAFYGIQIIIALTLWGTELFTISFAYFCRLNIKSRTLRITVFSVQQII